MNGYGEYNWSDGKKYKGEFKLDKKDGFGIYYCDNPSVKVYIGFWKNGKYEGLGKYITRGKSRFGVWSEGVIEKWINELGQEKKYLFGEYKKFKNYFQYDLEKIQNLMKE